VAAVAKRGRPKKVPETERREDILRDYVALMDIARLRKWPRPFQDRVLGRLAQRHHVKKRTILRYLAEEGVRPIRAANKNILKGKQAKKNLRWMREMKRKTKQFR
jgi:hypothetical protein